MAKKLGLRELEEAGQKLSGLNPTVVQTMKVVSVVVGIQWTADQKCDTARAPAMSEAAALRQRVGELRGQAAAMDRTAGQREARADQLDGYAALLK